MSDDQNLVATRVIPPNLPIRQAQGEPVAPITAPPVRPPIPPSPPPKQTLPVVAPSPANSGVGQSYTSQLRTMASDIGNISTGQAPTGAPTPRPMTPPTAPSVPVTVRPPVAPGQISIPSPTASTGPATPRPATIAIPDTPARSGLGRKLVYLGGVVALFVLGYVVVSILRSGSSDEVTLSPTPTPSPSATLAPSGKNLRTYFGTPGVTVDLNNNDTAKADFHNALMTSQPAKGQVIGLSVRKTGAAMPASDFLTTLLAAPSDLTGALATDWVALSFGQTETFDASGVRTTAATASPRLVLMVELADASKASQALTTWQDGDLVTLGQSLFGYQAARAGVTTFSPGTYRQISLKYQNFPYADQSLDSAIVLASNGKNYLVLSGSRESMFFAIDQLMQ